MKKLLESMSHFAQEPTEESSDFVGGTFRRDEQLSEVEGADFVTVGAQVCMIGDVGPALTVVKIVDDQQCIVSDEYGQRHKVMMTDLEPANVQESEDELAESIRAAFEDYVSNEKYDADRIYPGKKKRPTADKKPVKAPPTIDPTMVAEGPGDIDEFDPAISPRTQHKRNQKAVVSTDKPIGFRISDVGAGGKEYNVKTDKAWDDQHKTNEGTKQRKTNATWAQITDYEKRAKATKDDIKKNHYMQMAKDLRAKLPTNEAKSENRALWDKINSKGVVPSIDRKRYTDLSHEGLEGPFRMHNGKVVYYDPKAGQYYDRDTDMYISNDEMDVINHFGLKEDYAEFPDADDVLPASELKHSDPMSNVADKASAQSRVNSMMKTIRKIMLQLQNPALRREDAAKLESTLDSIKQNFAQLKAKFGVKGVALEDTPIVPAAQPVPAKPGQPAQAGAPAVSSAQTSENPPGTPPQATASKNSPPTSTPPSNPQQAPAGQVAQAPQTPVDQIKGLLQTLSTNPSMAKQVSTKLNSIH